MNYYIKDTLLRNQTVQFNTLPEVVSYLELLCEKKLRTNRKSYMYEMSTLGHGYDDIDGLNFTSMMSDHFEVGAIRSDGKLVKTDIHQLSRHNKNRNETGD